MSASTPAASADAAAAGRPSIIPPVNPADVDSTGKVKLLPWRNTVSGAALGVCMILLGCCANVWTLEILTKRDAGAGNLVTFAQFLLIATEGLVNHWQWPFGVTPRVVPLSTYVKITSIFFLTSLMNNAALDYDISIPVHTVFRSSGLTATLLLGRYVYKMKYPKHQVIACMLVSVGILSVTLADVGRQKGSAAATVGCCGEGMGAVEGVSNVTTLVDELTATGVSNESSLADPLTLITTELTRSTVWATGILMLSAALFLAAYLGHEQDRAYKRYGKNTWKEVLFYSHLFSLPGFLFVAPDIVHHFHLLASMAPTPVPLPFLAHPLQPSLLLVLLLNVLLQLLCIRGVYILTTNTNTLTCSLVLTFRKLLSLLLSVGYFGNRFTGWQWTGTALVFIGVLVYSNNPFKETSWQTLIKSPEGSRVSTPHRRTPKEQSEDGQTDGLRRRAAATGTSTSN